MPNWWKTNSRPALVVFLNLIKVETGKVIAAEEIVVSKRYISVSIIPDNYSDAKNIIEEISDVSGASTQDSIVNAWIERGNGATYRNGENLIINFYSIIIKI